MLGLPYKPAYTTAICDQLALRWPDNHTVNIVCHGHSVPSGYFCTPYVDTFNAYPHLLHRALKEKFPYAVINVIVTAIGGENAVQGETRFEEDVLCHRPKLITLDYGLNDRQTTLLEARTAWCAMIERALRLDIKVILLTPSWDQTWFDQSEDWHCLVQHAQQIRRLADEYGVGLVDTFASYQKYVDSEGDLQDLLSHVNHPSALAHQRIAREINAWFMPR